MATQQKVTTWEQLQGHPIAKELDHSTQLALLCEYVDLAEELGGMLLPDFIDAYFADAGAAEPEPAPAPDVKPKRTRKAKTEPKVEEIAAAPSTNGDGAEHEADVNAETRLKPASMVGLRVVYRFPGRNVLSDEKGVTRDSDGTVTFTDVDGESWSNVSRDKVYVIDTDNPDHYHTIHIIPREAKEFTGWLAGTQSKAHPDGGLLRSLFVEFKEHPDKIAFAIMNGKRPYVDRFVMLPENNFEDDQKPTTRLFGEHCFRVRGEDHVVNVVSP
jgi:hypothetical protein